MFKDNMNELSRFVKEEFIKTDIFEKGELVETLDDVNRVVVRVTIGEHINITFRSSYLKDYFISRVRDIRPDLNVINCNCTIDRFNENNFGGLLVFDNIKKCGHLEIIETIKQYKGVIIC